MASARSSLSRLESSLASLAADTDAHLRSVSMANTARVAAEDGMAGMAGANTAPASARSPSARPFGAPFSPLVRDGGVAHSARTIDAAVPAAAVAAHFSDDDAPFAPRHAHGHAQAESGALDGNLSASYLARRQARSQGLTSATAAVAPVLHSSPLTDRHFAPLDALTVAGPGAPQSSADVDYKLESLQLLLSSFKTKMRADFDSTFSSVDRKLRTTRRELLAHVTQSLEEVESRLSQSLKSSVGEYQLLEMEFRKNMKMDLYALRGEIESATREGEEARAEMTRKLRLLESVGVELRQKMEEVLLSRSPSGGGGASSLASEQQALAFQSALDALQSRLSLDVMSVRKDAELRGVELAAQVLDLKSVLDSLVANEEASQRQAAELIRTQGEATAREVHEKVEASLSNMSALLQNLYRNLETQASNAEVLHAQLSDLQSKEAGVGVHPSARRVTQSQLDELEARLTSSGGGPATAAALRDLQSTSEAHGRRFEQLAALARDLAEEGELRAQVAVEKTRKELNLALEGRLSSLTLEHEILKRKLELLTPDALSAEIGGKLASAEKDATARSQALRDELEKAVRASSAEAAAQRERAAAMERRADDLAAQLAALALTVKEQGAALTRLRDEGAAREKKSLAESFEWREKHTSDVAAMREKHATELAQTRRELEEAAHTREAALRDELTRTAARLTADAAAERENVRVRMQQRADEAVERERQANEANEAALRRFDAELKRMAGGQSELEAKLRRQEELLRVAQEYASGHVAMRSPNEASIPSSDWHTLQASVQSAQLAIKLQADKSDAAMRTLTEQVVAQGALSSALTTLRAEVERMGASHEQAALDALRAQNHALDSLRSTMNELVDSVESRVVKELADTRAKIDDMEHAAQMAKKYQAAAAAAAGANAVDFGGPLSPRSARESVRDAAGANGDLPSVPSNSSSVPSLRSLQHALSELEFRVFSLTQSESGVKLTLNDAVSRVESLEVSLLELKKRLLTRDAAVDDVLRAKLDASAFERFRREFSAQVAAQQAAAVGAATSALATAQQAKHALQSSTLSSLPLQSPSMPLQTPLPLPSSDSLPFSATPSATPLPSARTISPPRAGRLLRSSLGGRESLSPRRDTLGAGSSSNVTSPRAAAATDPHTAALSSSGAGLDPADAHAPDLSHAPLREILPVLCRGHRMLKHFTHGPPIPKHLLYSPPSAGTGAGAVHWLEPDEQETQVMPLNTIHLTRVTALRMGKSAASRALRRADARVPAAHCFELQSAERSVELQTGSRAVRDAWVRGLCLLLARHGIDYEFEGDESLRRPAADEDIDDSDSDDEDSFGGPHGDDGGHGGDRAPPPDSPPRDHDDEFGGGASYSRAGAIKSAPAQQAYGMRAAAPSIAHAGTATPSEHAATNAEDDLNLFDTSVIPEESMLSEEGKDAGEQGEREGEEEDEGAEFSAEFSDASDIDFVSEVRSHSPGPATQREHELARLQAEARAERQAAKDAARLRAAEEQAVIERLRRQREEVQEEARKKQQQEEEEKRRQSEIAAAAAAAAAAKAEAEARAKFEAEAKAREEAETRARAEAEAIALAEAEAQARREAEEKARAEAEAAAAAAAAAKQAELERLQAEQAARDAAERAEAERRAQEEAEAEAERAREEARRLEAERAEAARIEAERAEAARIEAQRQVEAERQRAAEVEAERRKAEALARARAEAEETAAAARAKAEAEAAAAAAAAEARARAESEARAAMEAEQERQRRAQAGAESTAAAAHALHGDSDAEGEDASSLAESDEEDLYDEEGEDDEDDRPDWLSPSDTIVQVTLRASGVPRLGILHKTELVYHLSEANVSPSLSRLHVVDRQALHGLSEEELEEYSAEHPDCVNGIFDLRFPSKTQPEGSDQHLPSPASLLPDEAAQGKRLRVRIYEVLRAAPTARADNLVCELSDLDLASLLRAGEGGMQLHPRHPSKAERDEELKRKNTTMLVSARVRRNMRERRQAGLEPFAPRTAGSSAAAGNPALSVAGSTLVSEGTVSGRGDSGSGRSASPTPRSVSSLPPSSSQPASPPRSSPSATPVKSAAAGRSSVAPPPLSPSSALEEEGHMEDEQEDDLSYREKGESDDDLNLSFSPSPVAAKKKSFDSDQPTAAHPPPAAEPQEPEGANPDTSAELFDPTEPSAPNSPAFVAQTVPDVSAATMPPAAQAALPSSEAASPASSSSALAASQSSTAVASQSRMQGSMMGGDDSSSSEDEDEASAQLGSDEEEEAEGRHEASALGGRHAQSNSSDSVPSSSSSFPTHTASPHDEWDALESPLSRASVSSQHVFTVVTSQPSRDDEEEDDDVSDESDDEQSARPAALGQGYTLPGARGGSRAAGGLASSLLGRKLAPLSSASGSASAASRRANFKIGMSFGADVVEEEEEEEEEEAEEEGQLQQEGDQQQQQEAMQPSPAPAPASSSLAAGQSLPAVLPEGEEEAEQEEEEGQEVDEQFASEYGFEPDSPSPSPSRSPLSSLVRSASASALAGDNASRSVSPHSSLGAEAFVPPPDPTLSGGGVPPPSRPLGIAPDHGMQLASSLPPSRPIAAVPASGAGMSLEEELDSLGLDLSVNDDDLTF